ncbi:MAG: hypothetical protein ACLP8B_03195, partial [Xanthobacteraceae bacterium]
PAEGFAGADAAQWRAGQPPAVLSGVTAAPWRGGWACSDSPTALSVRGAASISYGRRGDDRAIQITAVGCVATTVIERCRLRLS